MEHPDQEARPASSRFSRSLAVAFVCDHKLAVPAGAVATCLARLWKTEVHIFVERGALRDRDVMETAEERVFYHYDRLLAQFPDPVPDNSRFTQAAWGRLFLASALPDYDRILYLDVDIIPGQVSSDFTAIELPDGPGMVRDASFLNPQGTFSAATRALKVDPEFAWNSYFNSGVMLIDPGNWDTGYVTSQLAQYVSAKGSQAEFPDQDFLNHVFKGRIVELSPNLNFQHQLMNLGLIADGLPSVRHFTCGIKPFHQLPRHGTPDAVQAASEEYKLMCEEANLPHVLLPVYRRPGGFRTLKGLLRRTIYKAGFTTKKIKRMQSNWVENRNAALEYLESGAANRIFADSPRFSLMRSPIEWRFNGFEVLPRGQNWDTYSS